MNTVTMNDPAREDRLWTVKDVASYLRVSPSLIYMRAASGELPSKKVFGSLRFDPEEIKAYVRHCSSRK